MLKRIACTFNDIEDRRMLKDLQLCGESLELSNFQPEHIFRSKRVAWTNASEALIPLESDDAMLAILVEASIPFEPFGNLAIGRRLCAGFGLDRFKCRKDKRPKRGRLIVWIAGHEMYLTWYRGTKDENRFPASTFPLWALIRRVVKNNQLLVPYSLWLPVYKRIFFHQY